MIKKALRHSGIVGLFGQRQAGKTTLLESFSREYKTFDDPRELSLAMERPELFIRQRKAPFGIDEAQMCPPLFPALKESVRINKKPGLYLLSGSIRFTSRKAIQESLTGRIVGVEILPFTISESHERVMPDILNCIHRIKALSALNAKLDLSESSEIEFNVYLKNGGLPGICFFRDAQVRAQRFEFQIDTVLSRDYQLIHQTSLSKSSLKALLTYIALHQGESLNMKEAGDFSQISKVTLRKVIHTFESLFFIREVVAHPESGDVKSAYFLEDQGMATWLTQNHLHSEEHRLIRGLYANLRQELFYKVGDPKNISFFRTKNGVNVPLVFGIENRSIGIIPSHEKTPPAKIYAAAESFLNAIPRSIAIIACADSSAKMLKPNLFQIPYWKLV